MSVGAHLIVFSIKSAHFRPSGGQYLGNLERWSIYIKQSVGSDTTITDPKFHKDHIKNS